MKTSTQKSLLTAICLLAAFVFWTLFVRFIDVKAIGPEGSTVGFASLNGLFHMLTGVHMSLYLITDWLGLVPLALGFVFAGIGFLQWVRRKKLSLVDKSILLLGGFYVVVMAVYIFFETVVVNYRPVLIDGVLEASYPSSTTLLVMCVMPPTMMQVNMRIKNIKIRCCLSAVTAAFILFMVSGRLLSGVHWITDIIGSIFLSTALVAGYLYFQNKR